MPIAEIERVAAPEEMRAVAEPVVANEGVAEEAQRAARAAGLVVHYELAGGGR